MRSRRSSAGDLKMAKANQRAEFEVSIKNGNPQTVAPSERTSRGSKQYHKEHNHFPIGKTGYDPKLTRLIGAR